MVIDANVKGGQVLDTAVEFGPKSHIKFQYKAGPGCNNDLYYLGLKFDIKPDIPVEIRTRGRNRESGVGRILSVGSHLEPIRDELLPRGTSLVPTELGLPFLVSLPSNLRVVGGETVDLSLQEP